MSLKPQSDIPIPEETARIARAAFPKGNLYMKMRDEFAILYKDEAFADLFPTRGQPAEAPWRLAVVTVMQFVEGLPDRQAADAVRSRIDWKYALSLELSDPGFDASVLCEFRTRLLENEAEQCLFEQMLARFKERGLLKVRGRQRTDSTHVLAAIRSLNRLECLGETLRHALNVLAQEAPDWLQEQIPADWFDLYGKRFENYRLPKEKPERETLALRIGQDGFTLLSALWSAQSAPALRQLAAVETLRQVWVQQFGRQDGQVYLRSGEEMPPSALLIRSPYDVEARFSKKRSTEWVGDKVHLTETCEADTPHLITQVLTTPATTADNEATAPIQEDLANTDRLPGQQLVDEGYTDAALLVQSQQEHGVELLGPVARDPSRQAREDQGFDVTCFTVDWQNERAICPRGKVSSLWQPSKNARGGLFLRVVFSRSDCAACEHRPTCTRSKTEGRSLYLHPQPEHEALHQTRQRQETAAFRQQYAARAGIEGTLSQGVRAFGLRRSRYVGQAKTHLQNLAIAATLNLCRVFDWLMERPLATTRQSRLVRLKGVAATA